MHVVVSVTAVSNSTDFYDTFLTVHTTITGNNNFALILFLPLTLGFIVLAVRCSVLLLLLISLSFLLYLFFILFSFFFIFFLFFFIFPFVY